MNLQNLAIYPHIAAICSQLKDSSSGFLVLTAETGSGKSTGIPVGLLDAFPGKIYLLEPRRIAAVSVAARIAQLLGEPVGKTVGYRVHGDSCCSKETRLEVITEAILIRMLQDDPLLEGVSCVVLDEFHERSVYADLALAFLKESVQLQDTLRVLVMSATIDADLLCRHLDCQSVSVPGRAFPVEVVYAPQFVPAEKRFGLPDASAAVASAVRSVINGSISMMAESVEVFRSGVILCFLPGIADLTRCRELLSGLCDGSGHSVPVDILHSSVSLKEQQSILYDRDPEDPHVILSTSIAETSLTVPGVTTVIDCGLSRVSRFDAASGMNRLNTEIETEFSADQRKGRAGRVQSGTCIRLWQPSDVRVNHALPQVQIADITPVVLECAVWGARSMNDISWLDAPNAGAWQQAVNFLKNTGCLDQDCAITARGKQVASLGVHPRVALVALEAAGGNDAALEYASRLGAMSTSGGGDAMRREEKRLLDELAGRMTSVSSDLTEFRTSRNSSSEPPSMAAMTSAGRIMPGLFDAETINLPGNLCLLAGFYDRLAFHQGKGVYQLYTGRQATLAPDMAGRYANDAAFPKWIIVTASDSGDRAARIYDFEPLPDPSNHNMVASDDVAVSFADWLSVHTETGYRVYFEGTAVKKQEIRRIGSCIIAIRIVPAAPEDQTAAWCTLAAEKGLHSLPWDDSCTQFMQRAQFYATHDKTYAASVFESLNADSDSGGLESVLAANATVWLVPFMTGNGKLTAETVLQALRYQLRGDDVDRHVPVKLKLANGKEQKLVYEVLDSREGVVPVLEVIIQQIFGVFETPKVCGVPVVLHLLSPARRPLQVTRDLEHFWSNSWIEICKEMRGRYPKHNWEYTDSRHDNPR